MAVPDNIFLIVYVWCFKHLKKTFFPILSMTKNSKLQSWRIACNNFSFFISNPLSKVLNKYILDCLSRKAVEAFIAILLEKEGTRLILVG